MSTATGGCGYFSRKPRANLLLETLHRASRELRDDDPRGLAWDPALAERQGAENVAEIVCRNALAEQAVAVGLAGSPGELDPAQAELAELLLWGMQKGLADTGAGAPDRGRST
ncbi:hypothetical protein [Streptomyces sp. NPDC056480]|uniref:hypothetical protein n=1 Tax=Streptomyces sp. NPDC056480 TaxID=3345833 RepID=UPI003678FDC0